MTKKDFLDSLGLWVENILADLPASIREQIIHAPELHPIFNYPKLTDMDVRWEWFFCAVIKGRKEEKQVLKGRLISYLD